MTENIKKEKIIEHVLSNIKDGSLSYFTMNIKTVSGKLNS